MYIIQLIANLKDEASWWVTTLFSSTWPLLWLDWKSNSYSVNNPQSNQCVLFRLIVISRHLKFTRLWDNESQPYFAGITDQCNSDCSSVHSSSASSGEGSFLTEADFASAVARAAEMSGLTVVGTTVCDLNKASKLWFFSTFCFALKIPY